MKLLTLKESFYFSPPGQAISDGNIEFTNPKKIVDEFPIDKEVIDENTVILSKNGDRTIHFGAIPFKVISGGKFSDDSVLLLKEIMSDGYEVLTFKKSFSFGDKIMYRELVDNRGFILKDYSEIFCKIELATSKNIQSDEVCVNNYN